MEPFFMGSRFIRNRYRAVAALQFHGGFGLIRRKAQQQLIMQIDRKNREVFIEANKLTGNDSGARRGNQFVPSSCGN